MKYLEENYKYWNYGYHAPNVDHMVFRMFGRILKPQFGLPKNHEKLLDFGCGQGSAINFFHQNGFDVRGVDISEFDLGIAKSRYPYISQKFDLITPYPNDKHEYQKSKYKVITAFQSLYYFSKEDFQRTIKKLYDSLEVGGVIFATMMGTKSEEFYQNSIATDDPWLRIVDFKNDRIQVENYYMFFVESEKDLINKFDLFKPVHVGYYSAKFRNDEGDGFHWTFFGVKE